MRRFYALLILISAFCMMAEANMCHIEKDQHQSSIFCSARRNACQSKNLQSSIFNIKSSILKGDANGDGAVNVSDVTLVVNKVLGDPAVGFIAANCDMNSDGAINVSDVALIIILIMEGDNGMGPGDVEDPDVNGN